MCGAYSTGSRFGHELPLQVRAVLALLPGRAQMHGGRAIVKTFFRAANSGDGSERSRNGTHFCLIFLRDFATLQ
jgi:hypothetical protein